MPIKHNYFVLYGVTGGSYGQKMKILMVLNRMTNFIKTQAIAHRFGGDTCVENFV